MCCYHEICLWGPFLLLLRILEKELLTTPPFSFLKQEFLASMQKTYSAELASVDFLRASEEARRSINEWVKGQTGGERTCPPPPSPPAGGPPLPSPLGLTLGSTFTAQGRTAFKHRNLSKWKCKHVLTEDAKSFFPVSSPNCA